MSQDFKKLAVERKNEMFDSKLRTKSSKLNTR